MEFRGMSVMDFFENNSGTEICEQFAPQLLKYPLKLFYKKSCGEIFDLCVSRGILTADSAAAIQAAVEAK